MRRWNGWGDEATEYHLPPSAVRYLERVLGPGRPSPDADFDAVVRTVPATALPADPRIAADPADRLRHARGQSLPDWVATRSGRIGALPDGIARPASSDDVRGLVDYARSSGARLIPYGGGTSVVGGVNPRPSDRPALTVSLSRMTRLLDLDAVSGLARFEAGVAGPDIESQLAPHGYTLGHFPQSWELSTLGGWVMTRSSGQQSYYYGRMEDLFAGGSVETPSGPLDLPPHPASAAGPDLRQLILGSEGRFGILTSAIVRVRRRPEVERFYGIFFRDLHSGIQAVREMAQASVPVSMLRLSDPEETDATLNLAGKDFAVSSARFGLNVLGYGAGLCLLIVGLTGDRLSVDYAWETALTIANRHKGLAVGRVVGSAWRKSRFRNPYLRNSLWDLGYAADTLETAVPWSNVAGVAQAIKTAIRGALETSGGRVLAFSHISHVYADGASLYITYLWPRAADPDRTLDQWRAMKTAASKVITAVRGTISHHHGVGLDHAPYLAAEKGPVGISMLEAVAAALDPNRILNPGKLLD